jgi:hypothetical protein
MHLYVDRFNKRDWDGLRELISVGAQLRVGDRFAGPVEKVPYFKNYERQSVMVAGGGRSGRRVGNILGRLVMREVSLSVTQQKTT